MLILRKRLEKAVKETGRRLDIVQLDYLLSWILVAISQHPLLGKSLVFKGGTALKKCYFGKYRFSEDLDFTISISSFASDQLFASMKEVIEDAETKVSEYAPLGLTCERYLENEPHPHGQEAFRIRAQFPWQREALTVAMVEISSDETLLFPPVFRPIIHEYGEPINQKIAVYPIEEIVLEKLRAILQHTKKLHERDWNRSRARDYYDLWSIFNVYQLNRDRFVHLLEEKCKFKGVNFEGVHSFFDSKMLSNVQRTWNQWLAPLVPSLPPYDTVVENLRPRIAQLVS